MLFERKMIYEISTGVYNAGYILLAGKRNVFELVLNFRPCHCLSFRDTKRNYYHRENNFGQSTYIYICVCACIYTYIYIPLFSYIYPFLIYSFVYSFIFTRHSNASCERFFLAIPAWRLIVLHLTKKKKKIAYTFTLYGQPTNTVTNTETRKIHKKKYASRWKKSWKRKRKKDKKKKKRKRKKAFAKKAFASRSGIQKTE